MQDIDDVSAASVSDAPTRSRWDLAVEIVVYSLTHGLVDEPPVSFFRNDEEIVIYWSLTPGEMFAAAAAVCEASAKILPGRGSRPEVVNFASHMADHFAVRARAHSRRNKSLPVRSFCTSPRPHRAARPHARGRRIGRRRARAPARRRTDDDPADLDPSPAGRP
jgi:hypothetical protein